MTDFREGPANIDKVIFAALSHRKGMTALEVWTRCVGFPFRPIRDRLKAMAKDGDIDCKITLDNERAVREYRAKR